MKSAIPWALVAIRVVLAPVAIWLAFTHAPTWVWMSQFTAAILSDWLDGKLARRFGTATANLRQADSVADTIYALALAASVWFARPEIIVAHQDGILAVICLEALRYPLDWWLFGRGASYHAVSAKVFGASLVVVVTAIMGFGYVGPLLWISLGLGLVSEVEGVLISLVLPEWTHDVKTLRKAFEIRNRHKLGTVSA